MEKIINIIRWRHPELVEGWLHIVWFDRLTMTMKGIGLEGESS